MQCLFSSCLIADKGMYLLAKRLQNKRHWQLFFSAEKSQNKKINLAKRGPAFVIVWQRCMSRRGTVHIKLIIICHVRHGVWVRFRSGEKYHSMISKTRCLKCQRKPTPPCESSTHRVCQSQLKSYRNGKSQQQKQFTLTFSHFVLEAKRHYFQAVSRDECPKLSI